MRHRKKNKKIDRSKTQRQSLLSNQVKSLLIHGKIKTTSAKAKYLRPFAETLINTGKKSNLANRRLLIKKIGSDRIAKKILDEISPKYKDRKGGYTRIIKIGHRKGDGAEIVQLELI